MALRIPPLLIVLIAAILIGAVAWYLPVPALAIPGHAWFAALLGAVGAIICLLGIAAFRRMKTTVDPMHPEQASHLVVSGIYRFTRNPMYLGFAFMLLAWAVFLSTWAGVVVVVGYVAYLNEFQIKPEEKALVARFGEAFEAYRRSVRRWI